MNLRELPRDNPVEIFFSDRLSSAEEGFYVSGDELSRALTDLGYSYVEAIDFGWLDVESSYRETGWNIFFLGRDFDGNTQWECVKVNS